MNGKNEKLKIKTYSEKIINFPNFYDEKIKNEEKDNKKEKYVIDTTKIFSSFLDVYKYLEEVSIFINLNIKYFDQKLLGKLEKKDLENLNREYKVFYNKTYEKLEKVDIYLSLRRNLNIYNENVIKNNKKISKDVLILKREVYQFVNKILKLKKDIGKDRTKQEEKLDKEKINKKINKKLLNEKINVFYKNINELKYLKRLNNKNEGKYKILLKENALIYISIYRLFSLDENLFYKNFGKDEEISLDDIKEISSKIFSIKELEEFNNLKSKINKNMKKIKQKNEVFPNEAEEIVKNVSKYFGENFKLKIQNIFNNNQIDFFKSKDKISKNTTIGLDKGYILLQNSQNRVDLFTFVHELAHLMRYTYIKKDYAEKFIEESLAISIEFLLLDILLNDEKLKFKFEDQINDAILNFLSKTFDTIECFLFQQMVLEEIGKIKSFECNEDDLENKILKNVVSKRKEVLRKMGYKNLERKTYNFALSYSYLDPYYSLNYFLGIFVGFELFCKFKEKPSSENFEFFKTKKLDLKGVLNFLEKENVEDLIDVQKLFKYFEKTLKALNNKKIWNE